MSTLNVSALKNIGAGFTNLLLNSDGSVTLPVYTNASTPPVQFQAGTLWFNGTNLQIRNSANTAWVAVGGGGGGTVTGVAGTAPIVSSGGSAPTISILPATTAAAGSLSAADKVKIDALPATIVSSVTGTAPIAVATGTTTPVISANLATASDAATGTSATVLMTPQFAVPKDAANMTGAAILPSGTDAQRAAIATPVVGMQRYNTDSGFEEIYTGASLGWQKVAWQPVAASLSDVTLSGVTSLAPAYLCNNFTVAAGSALTSTGQGVYIRAQGNVTINASTWTLMGQFGGQSEFNTIAGGQLGAGLGAGQSSVLTPYINSKPYYVLAQLGGSSGASGVKADGSFATANLPGGKAGGYIYIVADGNVTFNGVVLMNCSGEDAPSPASCVGGGGGGGSGGCIIICSPKTITCPASVTFDVSGGNGANGIFSGNQGGGGGGGGGGYVILQSSNLVDSSTKSLSGGLGGSSSGAGAATPGGGGGAYAGSGGANGYLAPVNGTNGAAGLFLTGFVPV